MIAAVGSMNPVKIAAVREALSRAHKRSYQGGSIIGMFTQSGVLEQPIGATMTLQGARNRALAVRARVPKAKFTIGIESGIEKIKGQAFTSAWVVIIDQKWREGTSSTVRLEVPAMLMMDCESSGEELGVVVDRWFGTTNAKQEMGLKGLMTGGLVTRFDALVQAVLSAYAPWRCPIDWDQLDARNSFEKPTRIDSREEEKDGRSPVASWISDYDMGW